MEEHEPDYRFTLANERTFLAWQRTALGLLAAAIAVVHLVPELGVPAARHVAGGLLAALALVASVTGFRRWGQVQQAMRRDLPLPRHRSPLWLSVGLVALSALAVLLMMGRASVG